MSCKYTASASIGPFSITSINYLATVIDSGKILINDRGPILELHVCNTLLIGFLSDFLVK